MESTFSMKHSRKIIETIATQGPLSQYDMKKKIKIPYTGALETVKRLRNEGYVQVQSTVQSKTSVERIIYTLSFKGAVTYLSWFEIIPRSFIGTITKKDVDDFQERFDKENQSKLLKFLKLQGKLLDYVPFQECRWLSERYSGVARLFVLNGQLLLSLPSPGGFKQFIDGFKTHLSDPSFPFDIKDLWSLRDCENSALALEFGKLFLQSITSMKPTRETENEKLRQFAEKILNEKRSEIKPLEQAVSLFSLQKKG